MNICQKDGRTDEWVTHYHVVAAQIRLEVCEEWGQGRNRSKEVAENVRREKPAGLLECFVLTKAQGME